MSSKEKVVVVNTTSMVVFNSKKKSSLIENVANCGKTVTRLFLWSLKQIHRTQVPSVVPEVGRFVEFFLGSSLSFEKPYSCRIYS